MCIRDSFCFDTTITITIYEYAGESEAQDIINECFGLCNHYDKMFSTTKKDSDISKINQSKTKGCKVNHVEMCIRDRFYTVLKTKSC